MAPSTFGQLSIAPLGAGDLIDRAVRLYRDHFFVLIRIAAPPVLVAAGGSVLLSISIRQLMRTADDLYLAFYVLLGLGSLLVLFAGWLFSLIVMGGATRNLVTHLLWNEPVSARATYSAVKSRFWGLFFASLFVMFWVGMSSSVALFVWYVGIIVVALSIVGLAQVAPVWLTVIFVVLVLAATGILALWVFFFLAARVAYVPQSLLVEGKGIAASISRSFSLARGNVRRLMAMAIFTSFATNSALMILIVPLGWVAYVVGNVSPFSQTESPAWYSIGYSVISQFSYLLLAPIWMLGLSLLYVDERVRHEGYDIELIAARQLTEMPKLDVASPLAPALSLDPRKVPPPRMSTGSVLGLQ